ncbi:AAA family ATPase [Micromonospora arida]|uniref:AAA family ATPase n=1 Tax=Micromonospora arida TaxID=2203715 RepID=UPI003CFB6A4E
MKPTIEPAWPAFAREIEGTVSVHSQYVVHGNIRDLFHVPGGPNGLGLLQPLLTVLAKRLAPLGFRTLVTFDQVHGFDVLGAERPGMRQSLDRVLGSGVLGNRPSLGQVPGHLARLVGAPPPVLEGRHDQRPAARDGRTEAPRTAIVVDYASRILHRPGEVDATERDFFLSCLKMAEKTSRQISDDPSSSAALYNPVIWLVDSERDLPTWFTAGSERVRTVSVPAPQLQDRLNAAWFLATQRFGVASPDDREPDDQTSRQVRVFAEQTDGLTLRAMEEISHLAWLRGIGLADIGDAVRVYKLGVEDNPWRRNIVRDRIRTGEKEIRNQVLGQDRAITKTLDILKRAALGLSGAQASTTASRPRGVLFFAGPTGVGKTELAKNVAKLLFGDERAYLRFDMSEFSADQAADRLTGAPPGYVGYEAGGELTGAVRRQPFQVVLFDEIEKAHPSVLDKFLQILEDGRLTDGQGVTTYFSECVLIFTSNLGVVVTDPITKQRVLIADPADPYPKLEEKIRDAIKDHFTVKIGRPELLNRFGDNIVVFDFIDGETAGRIFDLQLSNIRQRLEREHRIGLTLAPPVEADLRRLCTADPLNGGRGIGNQLETNLINPLARDIFDNDRPPDTTITVLGLSRRRADDAVELLVRAEPKVS